MVGSLQRQTIGPFSISFAIKKCQRQKKLFAYFNDTRHYYEFNTSVGCMSHVSKLLIDKRHILVALRRLLS